jgi:hypothetical protein
MSNSAIFIKNQLCLKNAEYRCRVLSLIESHLGSSPNWKVIRSQLLGLFGDRGLEGDILKIFNDFHGGKK